MRNDLLFHFVNQAEYSQLKYPTTMSPDAALKEPYPGVAMAGCGLCTVIMMVEILTGKRMSVEEAITYSVRAGANRDGTDMKIFSKRIAEVFSLTVQFSSLMDELKECLECGGCAILNAGKKNGLFSDGGHFLLAFRYEDGNVWLADPSFSVEKYQRKDRAHQVSVEDPFVITSLEKIEEQCENREPAYYLFQGESQ